MSAKGKVKPSRFDQVPEPHLIMRLVAVRDETANAQNRTVEVVVATENPVERYDDERGIVLREILSMDGVEFRGGRNQLPIVDSHDRSSVANVLGSVRRLRVEEDELVGEASFASDERSQEAFQKLRDGHLTDFSITASPKEIGFIERGKQYTTRRGDVIDGPADIVTRWVPTDASLVATGADERSVVRRSYLDIPNLTRKRQMDDSLIQSLVAMGLPEGLTDPNAILAWVVGNMNAVTPPADSEPIESAIEADPPAEEEEPPMEKEEKPMDEELEKGVIDRALKADRKRQAEIRAICTKVGIEREFADTLCDNGTSLEVARKAVIERIAESNKPLGTGQPRVTESEQDKFYAAAHDGIVQRAYQAAGSRRTVEKPAAGSEDFRHIGLRRTAEAFVRRMGVNVERMSSRDIALVALGVPSALQRHQIRREAYHTTGSFAQLMLDAQNKTLLAGYEETPFTWNLWARQGPSFPDFREAHRIRFSELGSPEMVPENANYPERTATDQKESYKPEKYGSMWSVSWETVVNDDLDAISRVPAMQGTSCRRKQNASVYAILTANAALADGGALFNSTAQTSSGGHANLAGSTGAPGVTTLNAGYLSMRTKKGMNSEVILNITPQYIIVPAALEATVLELLGSFARPEVGGSAAGNSQTLNIYGPGGNRSLMPVVEPVLDANSTTAWYLAASNSQVDTVELAFLEGEESPVFETEWDFDKDCYRNKVRQTWGVKAIDYRGLYKNAG